MKRTQTTKTSKTEKPAKGKKPKPEMIKVDKQVVTDLASAVVWALKFLKTPSGGGMWTKMVPGEPMVCMPWQEKFMLALDGVGIITDRKAYWKQKDAPKKKTARIPRKDIHVS